MMALANLQSLVTCVGFSVPASDAFVVVSVVVYLMSLLNLHVLFSPLFLYSTVSLLFLFFLVRVLVCGFISVLDFCISE
ncbi:unnamed protein product [Linum trigynum]|uniref:Uncharacterized protein n=1 Tax=Linum trigynum TaxID=586398 RepID=A0AAV2FCR2_9ROSI